MSLCSTPALFMRSASALPSFVSFSFANARYLLFLRFPLSQPSTSASRLFLPRS